MFRILLVGAPVMVLCLVLQAAFVSVCLRQYALFRVPPKYKSSPLRNTGLLAVVMLIVTVGSILQVTIWGLLFLALGEFDQPESALYFSMVNFSTLGYGDIVMSERWRMLGPLEAFNGILMFGVSTAVMTAAVNYVVKQNGLKVAPKAGEPVPEGDDEPLD
jgi:hypothetical protein